MIRFRETSTSTGPHVMLEVHFCCLRDLYCLISKDDLRPGSILADLGVHSSVRRVMDMSRDENSIIRCIRINNTGLELLTIYTYHFAQTPLPWGRPLYMSVTECEKNDPSDASP